MDAEEKLKRLLQNDWEIHGEPKELLLLLREMYLDQAKMIDYVGNHTKDQWAKEYIKYRCTTHRIATATDMRTDIKTLCDWIHIVNCGIEPPNERTVKVGDVVNKYRSQS